MKWNYNALGLQSPLTWAEWTLMACVIFLLLFAGWQVIKFARFAFKIMKGE